MSDPRRTRPERLSLSVCLALLMAWVGCARLDLTAEYVPPPARPEPATLRLDRAFDAVWNDLVRRISQSFFDVEQVSKDSRLISLSVRDAQVDGLVDCGRLTYVINDETWDFDAARDARLDRSSYLERLSFVHRASERVGRMNIFVAPEEGGTRVEVNAIFELAMSQSGESVQNNLLGQANDRKEWGPYEAKFRLTTTRPDERSLALRTVRCQSSRKWEAQILDLVR